MKIKTEYIILAGIIVALSLYLAFHKTDETNYTLPDIPAIETKNITKLVIEKNRSPISLTKKDDAWVIAPYGYPVDPQKVTAMLETLKNIMLTDMISEKGTPEIYKQYELDDEKKISILAFDKDTLKLSFDMGKTAPSYRHTFVKLKDDPGVYYAKDNFRSTFDITIDNLRDKSVLSFNRNDVSGIAINTVEKNLVFQKNTVQAAVTPEPAKEGEKPEKAPPPPPKPVWQDTDGKEMDESKINRLMSSLSDLKCAGYMADDKKATLKDPIYTVTFKGPEDYTLSVYAKEDPDAAKYPVTSSQNEYAFYITGSTADDFMKIFTEEKKADKTENHKK